MTSESAYPFATDDVVEQRRLTGIARTYGPFTESVFRAAGVKAGDTVLDIGCGTGEVSRIAASIVGGRGHVVAIDRDRHMVDATRAANEAAGVTNIEVRQSDLGTFDAGGVVFDAVVGRLVLMYQPDPVEAVRSLAKGLRPGGVIALVESSWPDPEAVVPGRRTDHWPPSDLRRQVDGWVYGSLVASGVQTQMGLRLPHTYAEAGLVPCMDIMPFANTAHPRPAQVAAHIRSLMPMLIERGLATAEEIDIDTLEDRLVQESPYGLVNVALAIGAWATKP